MGDRYSDAEICKVGRRLQFQENKISYFYFVRKRKEEVRVASSFLIPERKRGISFKKYLCWEWNFFYFE